MDNQSEQIADQAMQQAQGAGRGGADKLKRAGMEALKKAGKEVLKAGLRSILTALAPYAAIVAAILFFLILIVAAVFYSMPQTGAMTGIEAKQSPVDKQIVQQDTNMANKYNVMNTWLVSQNPATPGVDEVIQPPPNGWYDKSVGTKLGEMVDQYGTDKPLAYTWSFLQASDLFYSLNFNHQPNQADTNTIADNLKPYFYYQKSEIITTTSDKNGTSTSVQDIYLLLESDTYQGHYLYTYKWVTKTYSSKDSTTTIQYEVLDQLKTLSTWDRFDKAIETLFKTKGNSVDSIALARQSILEAANAYQTGDPTLDWLLSTDPLTGGTWLAGPAPQVTDQQIIYRPIKNMAAVLTFLQTQNSAIGQTQLNELNTVAQEDNLNPLFLLAVTGAEQSFVPMSGPDWQEILNNPFNVTGGSGPGSWQTYQPGFEQSANIAARTLANDSLGAPQEFNVVQWIEGFEPDGSLRPTTGGYYGPYAAGWEDWIPNVSTFYTELQQIGD